MRKGQARDAGLGERIKAARVNAGMTQSELARRVGVGQSALGHVERGTRGIADDLLVLVADALEVPCADLVGRGGSAGWVEVPPDVLAVRRTLREDEWPEVYRGPAPQYWPGTLRAFVVSELAAEMRLAPDEVPLLAKHAVALPRLPMSNDEWKRELSGMRLVLGIKGRPVMMEMMEANDPEKGA
jgi:transcriptional regulator with XRE-family HTH domain